MVYCNLSEFTSYVGSEISTDTDFLADALAATEDAINDYCGRSFDTVTGALTRSYVAADDVVEIHDIHNTAGVTITDNGTSIAVADVQFEPINPVSWAGLTSPKYKIRLLTGCWSKTTNWRQATVSVTSSNWGWAAVPPEVKEATLILGKDIAHIRANRFGVAGFGDFGVVRVRDNPHVKQLLNGLRHPSAFGVG